MVFAIITKEQQLADYLHRVQAVKERGIPESDRVDFLNFLEACSSSSEPAGISRKRKMPFPAILPEKKKICPALRFADGPAEAAALPASSTPHVVSTPPIPDKTAESREDKHAAKAAEWAACLKPAMRRYSELHTNEELLKSMSTVFNRVIDAATNGRGIQLPPDLVRVSLDEDDRGEQDGGSCPPAEEEPEEGEITFESLAALLVERLQKEEG